MHTITGVRSRRRAVLALTCGLLALLFLAVEADPAEARLLRPRGARNRSASASLPDAMAASARLACHWDDASAEYLCDIEGDEDAPLTSIFGPDGNPRPDQMPVRPARLECERGEDTPDEKATYRCWYEHGPKGHKHPHEFPASDMGTFEDEVDEPDDPCVMPVNGNQSCTSILPPHRHGLRIAWVRHTPRRVEGQSRNAWLRREALAVRNVGRKPRKLSGFTILRVDADGEVTNRYVVPRGVVVAPGDQVVVHTGRGRDGRRHLYMDRTQPLWAAEDNALLVNRWPHDIARCYYEAGDGNGRRVDCAVERP